MVKRALTDEQEQAAITRYVGGEHARDVAKDYGIGYETVLKILKRHGVPRRKTGPIPSDSRLAGYVLCWPEPGCEIGAAMAHKGGRVLQHRYVMAKSLGRPLLPTETVHHINGDGLDNRIENLQLRTGRHGKHIVQECRACGSHDIVAVPLG